MQGLRVNTTRKNNPPDTRLKESNSERLTLRLTDNEDTEDLRTIIKEIKENQINEYHLVELNRLEAFLDEPRYKRKEISYTLQGLLLRLKKTGGSRVRKMKPKGKGKRKGKETRRYKKSKRA